MKRRLHLNKIGLLGMVAALALAACGGDDDTPTPADTPTPIVITVAGTPIVVTATPAPTIAAPPPAPKGNLNVVMPTLANENFIQRLGVGLEVVHWQVAETLLWVDKDLGLEPRLAESWEIKQNPDGSVDYTFELRQGIEFGEGWGEFTAEDAKFSIGEFIRSDAVAPNTSSYKAWTGGDPENIKVVDKHTLVVKAPKANTVVMRELGPQRFGVAITSKRYRESVGDEGARNRVIGTGPFLFEAHERGTSVALMARDEHWRQVPEFEVLNFLLIPEPSTQIALLRTGGADIIPLSIALKGELDGVKDVRIVRSQFALDVYIMFGGMWPKRPAFDPTVPYNDPDEDRARKVRLAMDIAIDKQTILDKIFLGEGVPSAAPFWMGPPGAPWTDPNWKARAYEPEKSKQLLTEAGYPDGFDVTMLLLEGNDARVKATQAVAPYWSEVGLETTLLTMDYSGRWRPSVVKREPAVAGAYAYAFAQTRVPEPVSYLRSVFWIKSGLTHTEHPFLDVKVEAMLTEVDATKRMELARQTGQWVIDEVWGIPIAITNHLFAVSPEVREWIVPSGFTVPVNLEYIQR